MSKTEPHYLGHRQRLRERFLKAGIEGLADYEAVELLLTLAIPRSDVKEPAKQLIQQFGNVRGILDAPLEELRNVRGIGPVTPAALKIIRAAATIYLQQTAEAEDVLACQRRIKEGSAKRWHYPECRMFLAMIFLAPEPRFSDRFP